MDRVDSIKIDPIRDLSRKPYQDTDTSFFIATLDHWREINLSKNFIDLVDLVDPISQSLPEIIFHQKVIFASLEKALLLNDSLSLQPILELLSQFCHDLGPDFVIYYERTLDIIDTIAVTQEDSDSLELIFNALAYIFKYLSRLISKDLIPTFVKLLPLLTLQHKDYVTKFVSQAISFLVRKAPTDSLTKFIGHCFNTLRDLKDNDLNADHSSFHRGLVVIFSQSLCAASGNLHSKSKLILRPLTESAILSPLYESALADIIMETLHHTESQEQARPLYDSIIEVIHAKLADDEDLDFQYLTSIAQVMLTLSFAESGRKVSSWKDIIGVFEALYEASLKVVINDDQNADEDKTMFGNSMAQWAAILMRNIDSTVLAGNHVPIFTVMSKLDDGSKFVSFVDLATDLSKDKVIQYCRDYTTQFVISHWKLHYKAIGFFLARMNEKKLIAVDDHDENVLHKLRIVIPSEFRQFILSRLEHLVECQTSLSNADLSDCSWRLLILENTNVQVSASLLGKLLSLLQQNSRELYTADLSGFLIGVMARQNDLIDSEYFDAISSCIPNFSADVLSVSFLLNLQKLLTRLNVEKALKSAKLIKENKQLLISTLAGNLKTPSHIIRELSLKNIIAVCTIADPEGTPFAISSCLVIEQIPLDMQHSRDIPLHYRQLSKQFASERPSLLLDQVLSNFAFGQLTVRFSPTWEGVFEFLAPVWGKIKDCLWENAFKFISTRFDDLPDITYFDYDTEAFTNTSDMNGWHPQDQRVLTNLQISENLLQKYEIPIQSIIEFGDAKAEDVKPTIFYRLQAIKLLNRLPDIAEPHFRLLLPYVINADMDDPTPIDSTVGVSESILKGWTTHDRNALIELLSKFKKLDEAYGIDQVKSLLLRLLMNKMPNVQTLALKCLLNLHHPVYNRYKDNLESLLDNTLFRDEVIQLLQSDTEKGISSDDVQALMPLVLRILFGRALTAKTSGTKQGRKSAAIKAVEGLKPFYIREFLKLSFSKIEFEDSLGNISLIKTDEINLRMLRNINGFFHMGLEVTDALKRRNSECFSTLINPLIFSLCVSEEVIQHPEKHEDLLEKMARNNRKAGFKLLYKITDYLGEDFDWSPYSDIIYESLIRPKLTDKFAQENLQGVSSFMGLMTSLWTRKNLQYFFYYDDFLAAKSLLQILPNPNARESSLLAVLRFVNALIESGSQDEKYVSLVTEVISSCLDSLVSVFENCPNKEVSSLAVHILLLFTSNDYITDNESKRSLIGSLTSALQRPRSQIDLIVREDIVNILSMLVKNYQSSLTDILPLYKGVAQLYEDYSERNMRTRVSELFESISGNYDELRRVGRLVSDLNAYSTKKVREPDYERRLNAYRQINNGDYLNYSALEWIPLLHVALFFINDEEDQAMSSSASYTLIRFVDCFSAKETAEEAAEYVNLLRDLVILNVRLGLRKENESVRIEYLKVVSHIVSHSKYYDDLADMKVLLYGGDEEDDFFQNIIHLQILKRQKCVRDLIPMAGQLKSTTIAHYILPLLEHYSIYTEDKFRNLAHDSIETVGYLAPHLTWHQFRAIFARYVHIMTLARIRGQPERLRDSVRLVVMFCKAMQTWSENEQLKPEDYPKEEQIDNYVIEEVLPALKKCLTVRNEDTVVNRVPLSEAMVSLVMSCTEARMNSELPGVLTGICQILRARSEELRDAVRKHLGRIAAGLGPNYLKFIFKELKGALTRGPQVHILGFTIHYLLVIMEKQLKHGDLGESADIIVASIMEDLFGEASEEKEAEGYSNKTKEIKHNKSYDTGELIAENINLKEFSHLLTPIKYLLRERLSLKTQNKLDQLLRNFSMGLVKNEESKSKDIIVLCYELYSEALQFVEENSKRKEKQTNEKEDYFMVHLDARPQKTKVEYSAYVKTMQKFSFELLRIMINKHEELFKVGYLTEFVPILVSSLDSDDERVIISALKVLTLLVKMKFSEDVDVLFTSAAKSVLIMLKDMPSTNNELAQNCLKFLSSVIRNKEDLQLKSSALSYILKKVEPDLDEPQRQGVAFGFLKSVISKHYMLAEVYDTMDVVSRIMVTSTFEEIRQVARSVFYTLLMEYDQSRGRLEKQFRILIDNLRYPAQTGRMSVMELIHLIVNKSGKQLLEKLSSSFFMALANVAITDDAPSCRKMASEIIASMLVRMKKLSIDLEFVNKFTVAWLRQNKNALLTRCGLNVYKLYVMSLGFKENPELNATAIDLITKSLGLARKPDENEEESNESSEEVNWQMVYLSLSTVEELYNVDKAALFGTGFEEIWTYIVDALLYPHSWVRLLSSRIIGYLLEEVVSNAADEMVKFEISDLMLQTVAYRTFRQLGAPNVSKQVADQVAKNLVVVSKKWIRDETPYIEASAHKEVDVVRHFDSAFDWAINRCSAILKNESRPNKEMLVAKKAIIQYCGFLTSVLTEEKLAKMASEQILVPLINLSGRSVLYEDDANNSLPELAHKCMSLISEKLGVSNYNFLYAESKRIIMERRSERKTKKAQLALNNPEASARRKLKKHMKFRKKRKNNKDENGLYRPKKKRRM
ncbi:hypothetical protein FOA43_004305 [Brettanomyces nanus]|uniref:U3 small nucleolar RNA-associated protein 20 n=1 Tax=Eeniella nana TaxID=13502 RepID=A0A875S5K8_EENNA|nr:uncharacterized protein FOA43_004305 [Brettanomyces nanus]QPG76911.1 hypothetical protein FOA43_004305 [Brettanomyces nanus]